MADKVYYCSNCGGIMEFNVKSQSLKCQNCDTEVTIANDKNKIVEHDLNRRAMQKLSVSEKKSSTMQCKGCGARVEVSSDCTATECPYCGSKYVLADKQEEAVLPDGVVPFKVDKNQVKETFSKWISKRWLAPGTLKNLYERDKIQGIYVPYWTFDADVKCDYSAQGGKNREKQVKKSDGSTTTETVTDWYSTFGTVNKFFDDVLIRGSKNLKESQLKGIENYEVKNSLVSYSPEYLSGYSAECYTVSLEQAHKDAVRVMEHELENLVRQDVLKRYDEVRDISLSPKYQEETYKHILIPVYSTAYSYANKNYTVLINGQTGKIKGAYPKSPVKIAIIIAIIVAIIVSIFVVRAHASELPVIEDNVQQGIVVETDDIAFYDEQYIDVTYREVDEEP